MVAPKRLEVAGLTVRFGGVLAVDDVSLTVEPGEIVGLIGPNGAGKSTLIDAICGFVRVRSGSVAIGGEDITRFRPHERVYAGLVRSWQSVDLFEDLKVSENLKAVADRPPPWHETLRDLVWPRRQLLTSGAVTAVEHFELEGDLDRLPTELSFSQRRLVTTARAAALRPSVLLLDEPAAGMSDLRRKELARLVRLLADQQGIGILVVDHDMPFVMGLCDRIAVLDFGRKIADGTPVEVRADERVIDAYLRRDSERTGEEQAAPAFRRAKPPVGDVFLAARDLAVGYYEHPVVRDINLEVRAGEVIALLGANRAGKTTTLLGLAGAIKPLAGEVYWLGKRIEKRTPLNKRAAQGLGFLLEGRAVFQGLSVMANLRVDKRCDVDLALELFPELEVFLKRRAGLLSGGQQQMLGLARALARRPKVLLVDEMSLGIAPQIVTRLMDVLRKAADEQGVGVVLVEQHVHEALRISDRVCVVAGGRMTLSGAVADVHDRVESAFLADVLGTAAAAS
jgi:sulfate-transporting ATPase